MILLIDNYDSFVYNLARYAVEYGQNIKVFRNDKITISEIENIDPKGIILSPGPCSPNESGICLELIEKLHKKYPILGVCLGHQAIGQFFGGKVNKAIKPIHGKTEKIFHNGNGLFKGIASPTVVTRYHSLIVDLEDNNELEINSKTNDNEIMAFQHKIYNVYGLQFHPESIMSEHGRLMIKNFIDIANSSN
ncbi:MAG: aminodeoxychorismate/anthranilate synthase component II [Alphaproteobacteria bacterium]|nr:aminodeoxychorismate/anthranilate synthase component II [Alphaproteobacteria bacterium]